MKKATAVFSETMEKLQHSTYLFLKAVVIQGDSEVSVMRKDTIWVRCLETKIKITFMENHRYIPVTTFLF
jgi:hypothetical protein